MRRDCNANTTLSNETYNPDAVPGNAADIGDANHVVRLVGLYDLRGLYLPNRKADELTTNG